ncbi:MAG: hypothetical protein AB1529_08430 [Candidatus Micrarchaeota archaeon]
MKGYVYAFILLALAVSAYLLLGSRNAYAEGSVGGPLHWHSRIAIFIDGKEVGVPDNLGLGGGRHLPVHTHEEGDGTVHFEFSQATIPKNQLTVGYFMNEVWGERFNSECVFDYCNAGGKGVKMLVNGRENGDFEHYVMADGDVIEIRYE